MSKQEAIEAMKQGKKVFHRYFDKDEWITMQGLYIVTEKGHRIFQDMFWADRNREGWDDGYSISK